MITIEKSFNDKKIKTEEGDVIKVQLAENAATGYHWKIKYHDNKHLNYTEDKYETSGEAIGAGGMKTFYFDVIKKGTSELHIALGNTWENDTLDTFNVTIES